jgi:restriction system protein
MPIPDFQNIMLPSLECLRDRKERSMRDVTELLAERFKLTEEERAEHIPSGEQKLFYNRVAWTKTHLKAAALLENRTRGIVRISDLGLRVLDQKPAIINVKFLKQYPSYLAFIGKSESGDTPEAVNVATSEEERRTPLELIDSAFVTLKQATADDLLTKLRTCSPPFFESVVVKLLMAMGYGGIAGEGTVTGKSGDGGIDGVIKQDKLGLEVVCIQAKRWEGPVGRPVIQGFVGSMDYIRAKKGVIMTTSNFTKEAEDFVNRIEGKKVVLIDGERLAELMIEHNLGVTRTKTYELKEVSNDFFDEDEV